MILKHDNFNIYFLCVLYIITLLVNFFISPYLKSFNILLFCVFFYSRFWISFALFRSLEQPFFYLSLKNNVLFISLLMKVPVSVRLLFRW